MRGSAQIVPLWFLAMCLGVVLEMYLNAPLLVLFCLFVILVGLLKIKVLRKLSKWFIFLIFIIVSMCYVKGFLVVSKEDIRHKSRFYLNKQVVVEGMIISDVTHKNTRFGHKKSFVLKLVQGKSPWGYEPLKGRLQVNVFEDADLFYGDFIRIEGKVHKPFEFSKVGNFSYRKYLSLRGIYFILSAKKGSQITTLKRRAGNVFIQELYVIRQHTNEILDHYLTKNEAAVIKAMLTGERSGIPSYLQKLFSETGTAHILAISGLHMGIVAGVIFLLVTGLPISRRTQLIVGIVCIMSYALFTSARPSVVRAAIMSSVFVWGLLAERRGRIANSLCVAGLIILLIDPRYLFDIGFQLSFSCVFGIVLLMPQFLAMFKKPNHKVLSYFQEAALFSLAVWVAVLGLVAYYFAIISPITVLANLIVVPLVGVFVVLAIGLVLAHCVYAGLAGLFAVVLSFMLNLLVVLIFLVHKIPFGHFIIKDIKFWHVSVYYVCLLGLVAVTWRKKDKARKALLSNSSEK